MRTFFLDKLTVIFWYTGAFFPIFRLIKRQNIDYRIIILSTLSIIVWYQKYDEPNSFV